jgi:hypothetical protein
LNVKKKQNILLPLDKSGEAIKWENMYFKASESYSSFL